MRGGSRQKGAAKQRAEPLKELCVELFYEVSDRCCRASNETVFRIVRTELCLDLVIIAFGNGSACSLHNFTLPIYCMQQTWGTRKGASCQ